MSDGLRPSDPTAPAFEAPGLAAATGGRLVRAGRRPIRGGAVDSRRVTPGAAFFALPGERTDGHRFLRAAVDAGAAALIVRDLPDDAELDALAGADAGVSIIAVADPGAALLAAARAWRDRWSPLVVGITGSLAKTSTKEQVAEVLAERWTVLKNEGNENNEIGLPLTLLRSGPQHEAFVLEMGLYVPGDIDLLARLARPTIGVVTAVRGVHLSRAGTIEAIENGKRELIEALPAGGTAILNADDARVTRWTAPAGVAILRYGFAAGADVTATGITALGADGMAFTLVLPDGSFPVRTPALGRHSVHNALAAAAVGVAAGLDHATIARGIARGFRAPHRTALVRLVDRLVLDDSYNASPDSVAAALELLATLPGRKVAVLGEMLELGDGTLPGHLAVGRDAARRADLLLTVGPGAAPIADGALDAGMPAERIVRAEDRAAATAWLAAGSRAGDAILVKASRGAELDLVVDDLVRLFGDAAATGTPGPLA
ncbi:MAG: UDP-N-acetylmuramoyl-tripeptide--D-alanyl-D-alanine ligase [Chloroflexota bacterium]